MVWFNHAFLGLNSRNNTNAARRNTITSKITGWLYGDEKIQKNKKFHVSQLRNRVLTCWITKGWRKTTWVKFSASPAASTNQISIEDVLQEVIKVIKNIKSTSGKINIKSTTKNSGEKHAYVQGVGWVTIEVDRRENSVISTILQNVTSRGSRRNFLRGGAEILRKIFLCPFSSVTVILLIC